MVDFRGDVPRLWQPEGTWRVLGLGQRMETHLGPFCFTATMGIVDDADNWRGPMGEVRPALFWLGSAIAQLSLLAAMFYSTPRLTDVEPLLGPVSIPYPVVPFLDDATSEPEQEDPLPGIASSDSPYLERIPGLATRCSGYGMGMPNTTNRGRYAVMGPKDNPDPHISRALPTAKRAVSPIDMVGIENLAETGDPQAPFAPWGRDTSLGTDEVSARGKLWGDEISDGQGNDDLAESPVDGGLLKRIEISRAPSPQVSTSPQLSRPARVIHTQSSVRGSILPTDAEHVIAPQLMAFRECYFADPSSHGDHEGHAELAFVVESGGSVKQVTASKSNQVDAPLLTCILSRAKELTFPSGNGETQIAYPIHFVPGFEPASARARAIPLAPEIVRERYASSPCSGKRPTQTQKLQPCSR